MKTIEKYVVISKESQSESHMSHNVGKKVLISFASKPIFEAFYWLKRKDQSIPNYMDKYTCEYALKKYANTTNYEVILYSEALKQFKNYKYGK